MFNKSTAVLVLLCIALPCAADDTDMQFKGYYKNLLSISRTVIPPQDDYTLDVNRLRLELRGQPREWFGYEVQYDNEALLGSYLQTEQFALLNAQPSASYWDLENDYLNRGSLLLRQRLYRGFIALSAGDTTLRFGRQRIAWGSGRLWNPTDLLNPYNPAQLEPQERTGVDAVLLEQNVAALSRLSVTYAPQRDAPASRAIRYRANVMNTDVALLAGEFRGQKVIGLDLAGSLSGAGIYAEVAYTHSELPGNFTRAVVGFNYAFPNTVTIGTEVYWNGAGTTERTRYEFSRLLAGEIQNVARRYVGAQLNYQLTPLLRTDNTLIFNLDDRSRFFAPSLVYSLVTNWDVVLGLQLFGGSADSEYGRLHSAYNAYLQWFF